MRLIVFQGVVLLLLQSGKLFGQEISLFQYLGSTTIAHNQEMDKSIIGGLSGINFNPHDSLFYLVADKPPARIYKLKIDFTEKLIAEIVDVIFLEQPPLKKSELEGIASHATKNNFYLSDEQGLGTRIIEVDSEANFIRIVKPLNQAFLPLSNHNSGIEGLTFDPASNYIYYAYERPTDDCFEEGVTVIARLSLDADLQTDYYYRLHKVANDKLNTNGITELIFLQENVFLVMERAYIPSEGNVVRLYQAYINTDGSSTRINCNGDSNGLLSSSLLFDFCNVNEIKIDNAEGMAFNADRSILFIVTDNNFSKKQQTQIIALRVNWE